MRNIRLIFLYLLLGFLTSCEHGGKDTSKEDGSEDMALDTTYGVPDFVLSSVDGQPFQLSSQRGKYVLLDFWASWCMPCRAGHPDLVQTYYEYKDKQYRDAKGLSFVSVSIDEDMQKWKEAVSQDNLVWENHAIDPSGWNSRTAALYNIQYIPKNFLLDPDGKILAQDLHGERLRQVLDKQLAEVPR